MAIFNSYVKLPEGNRRFGMMIQMDTQSSGIAIGIMIQN
jgi:hypothetical protein